MGHKLVCLSCRKAFSVGWDNLHKPANCPECGEAYVLYTHRFRPPKNSDINAWKVVRFLYEHGFVYQHIYNNDGITIATYGWGKEINTRERQVDYPTSLIDAKEFVITYKNQAIKTFVPPLEG